MTTACVAQLISSVPIADKVTLKQSLCIGQSDLPKARSRELSLWYEKAGKDDLFMFIDADQIFTADDILRSLAFIQDHNVVCGAYPRKSGTMTVEPEDVVQFHLDKEGTLYYGATGFMMIRYDIVKQMVEHFGGKPIHTSRDDMAYPFFYERIVDARPLGGKTPTLWLGEDYSFCWLTRELKGSVYGYISPTIGHILTMERFVEVATPKVWPEKSIVVYCGRTSEAWSPLNLDKGIGGSETAVIHLTREWAKHGYEVTVFCTCDKPGVYSGVTYKDIVKFGMTDKYDIFILWRNVNILDSLNFKARKCFLDLHDVVSPEQFTTRVTNNVTKICVKSNYHKSLLGNVPEEKVAVIPNGGFVQIEEKVEKDSNYLIYSSSYDRGLPYMLKYGWPLIKKACPDAYLKIFYGWEGFDALQAKTQDTIAYKKILLELMKQDGVSECGRISNAELLKEKAKANIHYYIGDFQEIDCISVRESACLGAIPIVSNSVEVFAEKPYCIKIPGDPHVKRIQEKGVKEIVKILKDKEYAEKLRTSMKVPEDETWEMVAKRWQKMFD